MSRRGLWPWSWFLIAACLLVLTGCAEKDSSPNEPDTTPPVVVSVEEDGGRVSWQTDEDCLCVLVYGRREGLYNHYGYSVYDGGRDHYVDLLGANQDDFYFRIIAVDPSGNTSTTDEFLFAIDEVPVTENLVYTMVNVGWGDCHFLEFPNGTNVMIDAGWGNWWDYEHGFAVDQFLSQRGMTDATDIDYMIGTHDHADHYAYFRTLLFRYYETTFLAPGDASASLWKKLEDVLRDSGVETDSLEEGQTDENTDFLNWDEEHGVKVKVLSSGAGRLLQEGQGGGQVNNDSAVLKVTYGEVDIVLGGDAEHFAEQRMVRNFDEVLDAEILKIGHHGNDDASSTDYLRAVSPRVGLIPNSLEDNPGVFDQSVINRLRYLGIDYYVSDRAYWNPGREDDPLPANISVITDGETYVLRSWN